MLSVRFAPSKMMIFYLQSHPLTFAAPVSWTNRSKVWKRDETIQLLSSVRKCRVHFILLQPERRQCYVCFFLILNFAICCKNFDLFDCSSETSFSNSENSSSKREISSLKNKNEFGIQTWRVTLDEHGCYLCNFNLVVNLLMFFLVDESRFACMISISI